MYGARISGQSYRVVIIQFVEKSMGRTSTHFKLMAVYNQRMNRQLYECANKVSSKALTEDLGAYFNSILGTLNHILIGDIVWLKRFSKYSERFTSLQKLERYKAPYALDQMLYDDLSILHSVREDVDVIMCNWIDKELFNKDLAGNLVYENSVKEKSTRNLGELLSHLFNHQTHHRGQLSTLLYQQGIDIGVTDYLVEIPAHL